MIPNICKYKSMKIGPHTSAVFLILENIESNRYYNTKSITRIITSVVQMLAGDTIAKQAEIMSRS